MKKFQRMLFLIAILYIGLAVSGCGNAKILGKWYETTGLFGGYEFLEDGVCIYEFQNPLTGKMESNTVGYKFSGKKGTIFNNNGEKTGFEYDATTNQITLITDDNFSMIFTRNYVEPTLKETMSDLHQAQVEAREREFERETGMTLEEYDAMKEKEQKLEEMKDPMKMAASILVDPQVKTESQPDTDMGEDFAYVAIKKTSEDGSYVEFGSDDEGAYFGRNELLNYDNRNNNQAVIFRFIPNNTTNLQFTLMNDNEMVLKLEGGGSEPQNVNVHQGLMTAYSDYTDTGFVYQEDACYWALMAVDGNGIYRAMIWQEVNPENKALYQDDTGVTGGDWKWIIGFDANQSLFLFEYMTLDFEQFADMSINLSLLE